MPGETRTPRQALLTHPDSVELVRAASRELEPGEIRVRPDFGAAKHGTEMATINGSGASRGGWDPQFGVWRPELPPILGELPAVIGNMVVGTVEESRRPDIPEGARVVAHASFAESVVATQVRVVPDHVRWQSAVCLDPAEFALAALRDGSVRIGDAVAVFGLGAIGLLAVHLAKVAGASPVIACDPLSKRRDAASTLGADEVIDSSTLDAGLEIKRMTARRGADVVIDYSGNVHALQSALRGVAFGGTVVAGAFPAPYPPGLDLGAEAHMNRPNIVFSRAASDPNRDHPRWTNARIVDTCWTLICDGSFDGSVVVDPVVAFDDLPAVYVKTVADPASSIKLGVAFDATGPGEASRVASRIGPDAEGELSS